jgi:ParB-like chromosome segregation protein Spo0J
VALVTGTTGSELRIAIGELGERLAPLRLCDPTAVDAVQESLSRCGQLTAVAAFEEGGRLEIMDGFKRLMAARRLGWSELRVARHAVDAQQAILQIPALHAGRGLTELEEGWLVRALYREHKLSQPAIAERLGHHKTWVYRRLLLVEALDTEVQARVRLGLIGPRTAVVLTGLPRGNQIPASDVVARRGLTVRQTELLVTQLLDCAGDAARTALMTRWMSGEVTPGTPGPRRPRPARSEADWLASDVAALHRIAARVQARLIATPLLGLGPAAAELVAEGLEALVPVLTSLSRTIVTVTTSRSHTKPGCKESAA